MKITIEDKVKAFEYFVLKLRDWNMECNCGEKLNQLKVMRLLFFVSGVDTENHLFDIFDNFEAWQYGHNERDIYNILSKNKGEFSCFNLQQWELVFYECEDSFLSTIPERLKIKINTAFDVIKSKNTNFICYDTFTLVDIDHSSLSYKTYNDKWKEPYTKMNKDLLIYEPKIF